MNVLDPTRYKLEVCTSQDIESLVALTCTDFAQSDYWCQTLKFPANDDDNYWRELIGDAIKSNVSVLCREVTTAEIVGFRISKIEVLASEDGDQESHGEEDNDKLPWRIRVAHYMLDTMHADEKILLPDARRVMQFLIMNVRKDHRRRGIAEAMLNYTFELGKKAGCDHCVTVATNVRSQNLFTKLNFIPMKFVNYEDVYYDGQKVFTEEDGFGTKQCILFVKKI